MMSITQQVRDYAAKLAEKEAGMAEMSEKFIASGAEVYVEQDDIADTQTRDASTQTFLMEIKAADITASLGLRVRGSGDHNTRISRRKRNSEWRRTA